MSVHVLAEVTIGDLDQFLAVFGTDGAAKRAEHGCLGAQVFTPDGTDGRVTVLLEWPDTAAFEAFRADPDVPSTMRKGGAQGPPSFTVLQRRAQFDA